MEDGRLKRTRDEYEAGNNAVCEDSGMPKRRRGEGPRIELRILMQSKNAGAIIGKGGANIYRLRNEYKASVTVPDSHSPERVLTIGADLGSVLAMLMEVLPEMDDPRTKVSQETEVRLIVHQSQVGTIIQRSGLKVKELAENPLQELKKVRGDKAIYWSAGCYIKVFSNSPPNSTDRVVGITGKPKVVVACIEEIVELLQTSPPKGSIQLYDPTFSDERLANDYGGFITGGDNRAKPSGARGAAAGGPRGAAPGGSVNSSMLAGLGLSGVLGSSIDETLKNMAGGVAAGFGEAVETETSQVTIPKDLAGAIIGKGGSRITDIRRRSGAQIVIGEVLPGSTDRIISITGTNDQIQNAQYMLQMTVKQNASAGSY